MYILLFFENSENSELLKFLSIISSKPEVKPLLSIAAKKKKMNRGINACAV